MVSTDLYDTEYLARLTVRRLAELNKTRAKVRRGGTHAQQGPDRRLSTTFGLVVAATHAHGLAQVSPR